MRGRFLGALERAAAAKGRAVIDSAHKDDHSGVRVWTRVGEIGKSREIPLILSTTREFVEELKKSVKASLEAAGYSANYQDSQRWPATFIVSSGSSQGGVTLIFGEVCERCGESLPYRVQNSQGAFGGRVAIPRDCDADTAADCLLREALPLLTNRLPAATHLDRGVGAGLLSPQEAGKLSEALKAGAH